MKPLKSLPQFKSEAEEQEFWLTHDSTDYVDWSTAEKNPSFPNLKPSSKMVSIRLPDSLVRDLKSVANKKDVPYQSLVKVYLSERIKAELG